METIEEDQVKVLLKLFGGEGLEFRVATLRAHLHEHCLLIGPCAESVYIQDIWRNVLRLLVLLVYR